MEYQSLFQKKMAGDAFVYTAETTPPDASDQDVLLAKIKPLKGNFIFWVLILLIEYPIWGLFYKM